MSFCCGLHALCQSRLDDSLQALISKEKGPIVPAAVAAAGVGREAPDNTSKHIRNHGIAVSQS